MNHEERYGVDNTLTDLLVYEYDENGDIEFVRHKTDDFTNINSGKTYLYIRDGKNEIVALALVKDGTTATNQVVAKYQYTPYGEMIRVLGKDDIGNWIENTDSAFIGNVNPIRYKGYYYDTDTGYYYLQSRYYDPDICHFLNMDDTDMLDASADQNAFLSANLFSYCANNPVMNEDTSGYFWERVIVAGVSGVIFGGIAYLIGKAFGLRGKSLRWFTAAFVGVGIIIGLIWGVRILSQIRNLIKPVIYFFSNPGKVYFGVKILGRIQFELHNPHHGKAIHFVIRILRYGRMRQVFEYIFKK